MKRLEAKYTALHMVPLIERLGTPQVQRAKTGSRQYCQTSLILCYINSSNVILASLPLSANRYCARGRSSDEREAVLWPVHVRGHPSTRARLPGRSHLARTATQQRRDARGRVRRVPSTVERHAVRVLHPGGSPRVHSGVSAAVNMTPSVQHTETAASLLMHPFPVSPGSASETASTGPAA